MRVQYDREIPCLGLFLPNHDWRFQMEVNNDQHFAITRLEEKMLDITEKEVWTQKN